MKSLATGLLRFGSLSKSGCSCKCWKDLQEQPDLLKLPKRTKVMQLIHEVREVQVHEVKEQVHEV